MKTDELREKYLEFFQSKDHTRCDSDVLVPTWDPSVLFTPAGMNQFKDHFLGKVKLEFTRATTCQKCLRTGDIENVGRTAYHHTFFEMLGNFSFGDYFKRDAINWAWEFLTDKKWLGIDPARLTVTVYKDDDEAADIWSKDIGLSDQRVARMEEDENFWPASAPSQGPDGVCGPCSEIYYKDDFGDEVEIWNLVFTQFNRVGDPPDNLRPLPSKNIDTGMGLERTAASLQGVETNYHIDTLMPIVKAAADVCGRRYSYDSDDGRRLRRITDHIRACAMAVHENVYPGPQKERYVIRRLLRRAVLDGHQMGLREPFLFKIVPAVAEIMKVPYPDVVGTTDRVAEVIKNEEQNFFGTIDAGLSRIENIFAGMEESHRTKVDGAEAADLFQTFGVPPEVFEAMAAEKDLVFDWEGYKRAMDEHGQASGKAVHTVMGNVGPIDSVKKAMPAVEFLGYETTKVEAELRFIIADDLCDEFSASAEQEIILVLERSPFYGESGGQVGDSGTISGDGFSFQVTDVQRDSDLILHHGHLNSGRLEVGARVTAEVDASRREGIQRAHSATHILHYALRKHLGTHAQQQGSKVEEDLLRFDFTHMAPVTPGELDSIQTDVRQQVHLKQAVKWETLPLADARAQGAMMLFGEKYPDPVRMVSMGDFSRELCGGTHLPNTGEVGAFEIVSEEGISAGTRRLVALTGDRAAEYADKSRATLAAAAELLSIHQGQIPAAATALTQRVRDLKKQLAGSGKKSTASSQFAAVDADAKTLLREAARTLNVPLFEVASRIEALLGEVKSMEESLAARAEQGGASAGDLLTAAIAIGDTQVIVADIPLAGVNLMRQLVDQIRKQTDSSAILLASSEGEGKVVLLAALSRDLVDRKIQAGPWVKEVAALVGGGGGGKPDMAQAGGKYPAKIPEAIAKAKEWIGAALGR